jgi:hypothetical protein
LRYSPLIISFSSGNFLVGRTFFLSTFLLWMLPLTEPWTLPSPTVCLLGFVNEALPIDYWSPEIELFRFSGGGLDPWSEALSELRREYCERFSAKFDLEIDRAKPWGPAVN